MDGVFGVCVMGDVNRKREFKECQKNHASQKNLWNVNMTETLQYTTKMSDSDWLKAFVIYNLLYCNL